MSKHVGQVTFFNGLKYIWNGAKWVRPVTFRSYNVALAPAVDPLVALRADLVGALGSESAADAAIAAMKASGVKAPRPKSATGNTRATRAAGTFKCPDFGKEFYAAGVHHLAACGIDDNGGFGTQKRLDAHIAWSRKSPRTAA